MSHTNYVDDRIIQAIHDNGFFEDIWGGNGWMADIRHNKHHLLDFFFYFDYDNKDYSFVESLMRTIDRTKIDEVMQNISRYYAGNDFSIQEMRIIQDELESDISKLRKSLYEIKQWMDGAPPREVTYDLSLNLTVNNKEVTLKDLTESEKEKVKKQCWSRIHLLFDDDKVDTVSIRGYFKSDDITEEN